MIQIPGKIKCDHRKGFSWSDKEDCEAIADVVLNVETSNADAGRVNVQRLVIDVYPNGWLRTEYERGEHYCPKHWPGRGVR